MVKDHLIQVKDLLEDLEEDQQDLEVAQLELVIHHPLIHLKVILEAQVMVVAVYLVVEVEQLKLGLILQGIKQEEVEQEHQMLSQDQHYHMLVVEVVELVVIDLELLEQQAHAELVEQEVQDQELIQKMELQTEVEVVEVMVDLLLLTVEEMVVLELW